MIRSRRKDDRAWLLILVAWFAVLLLFNPRLFALLYDAPNTAARVAVIVFVLCLDTVWFYAIYHLVMVTAAVLTPPGASLLGAQSATDRSASAVAMPRVAVLYPTRNDFNDAAAQTCVDQAYAAHHVFLLDDSTRSDFRSRVDAWAAARPGKVTVLRRDAQTGYKAGNLNAALKRLAPDYPYFAICDADGRLPKDFLAQLVPQLEAAPDAAFVQALQAARPDQPDAFAQTLSFMAEAHYRYYAKPRSRFGFMMFYGHGGVVRTAAWQAAGGFPEIVTEDLAFSAKARALGWTGLYADRAGGDPVSRHAGDAIAEPVRCLEDFPATAARYRTRAEKWIRGTSEFLLTRHFGAFARSRHAAWFEKLDVLVNAVSLYQPAIMLVLLLTLGTLLPEYFAHFRYPGSFFLMPVAHGRSPVDYLLHIRYHIFWSPDFYVMMAIALFAPLLPAMLAFWRKPGRAFEYVAASQFVFLSSLVAETASLLAFLLTGKAVFRNTQDADAQAPRGFHPNHPLVRAAELAAGALMAWLGWRTKNLWFWSPAAALLTSWIVEKLGWRHPIARLIVAVPFVLTLLVFAAVTVDLAISSKSH